MALVIDASIVAAWALAEEHGNAELTLARVRTKKALVPGLWWHELRNVLVIGERRGRLTEQEGPRFLRDISGHRGDCSS
jgi:predicted nucleic acid-binding protein